MSQPFTLEIRRQYLKGAHKKPWIERRFYENGACPIDRTAALGLFYFFGGIVGVRDPADHGGVDLVKWYEATANLEGAKEAYLAANPQNA